MDTILAHWHDFALVTIITAAFIDTFIVSGYILYGFALLANAGILYAAGTLSIQHIFIGALIGTTAASMVNFYIGTIFAKSRWVQQQLKKDLAVRIQNQLHTRGLFIAMLIARFITLLRPMYGLVIGTLNVSPRRFILCEIVVSIIWVTFWATVLYFSTDSIDTVLEYLQK